MISERGLTNAQIARQDEVDNAIYNLVQGLIPERYRERYGDGTEVEVAWDIEWIAEVREVVMESLIEIFQIPRDNLGEFEMDFYPYVEEEGE